MASPRLGEGRADLAIVAAGLAAAALFVLAERRLAGGPGLPLDDAWIHLRFAQNVARGRGFGINPGEPIAGSTAPLWTLGLAGLLWLGVPGLAAAKTLGLGSFVATGLLTRRLARALGSPPSLALAAGLGTVALSRLVWGALSGMEVPLAAALVTAGALLAARARPHAAAVTLGLAALARPEAGLLIVLHALAAGRFGPAVARAVLGGAVLVPAMAFSLATAGRLVPLTASAKATGGLLGHAEGVVGAWEVAGGQAAGDLVRWVSLLARDHVALPVLAAVGLVVLRRGALRGLGLALVLHPLAVALLAPYREPAFQTGRYSAHLLPLAVVAALAGLQTLARFCRPRLARLAVAGGLAAGLLGPLPSAAVAYGWGVQNIEAMQIRLGRWLAAHTPPDAVVAVNDIGALSYFGDRRILDLMGLVTPEVLPYRRLGPEGVLRFVVHACPDYLVIFPAWFPALAGRSDLFEWRAEVHLAHNVVAGASRMVVYETAWSRWRPPRATCPSSEARFLDTGARGG